VRVDYDPLRPDFIEVAGGFPALTGGAGGAAGGCSFVGSGIELGCGPFFFFEKSGISFFLFILVSVQEDRSWLPKKISKVIRSHQERARSGGIAIGRRTGELAVSGI
jgi:hypothetical protein